jgi:ATP-dependent Clp protease ATP-binding subunit ClpC
LRHYTEFLNRLDEIIVFRQLNKAEVREIAGIMLQQVFKRLKDMEIILVWWCRLTLSSPL